MKVLTVWQPYIAGVLHGDGWCTRLTLGLRSKDREFASVFAEGINHLIGINVRAATDERGYWLVRASNKSGRFDHLRRYEPANADEACHWLRGLFDSEGNAQLWLDAAAGPSSYHRRVAIYSTDLSTIWRATQFMTLVGIDHTSRATKNSASHKGTKVVYELRVVRQAGFARFFAMVGSTIERKHEALRAIVDSYQPPGWQKQNWNKAVAARWGK